VAGFQSLGFCDRGRVDWWVFKPGLRRLFFPRVFLKSSMSLLRMVDLLRLFQQYFDVEPIAAPQALYVPADREVSVKDRSGAYFQFPTGVRQMCWY
jgi:hypothetical protein